MRRVTPVSRHRMIQSGGRPPLAYSTGLLGVSVVRCGCSRLRRRRRAVGEGKENTALHKRPRLGQDAIAWGAVAGSANRSPSQAKTGVRVPRERVNDIRDLARSGTSAHAVCPTAAQYTFLDRPGRSALRSVSFNSRCRFSPAGGRRPPMRSAKRRFRRSERRAAFQSAASWPARFNHDPGGARVIVASARQQARLIAFKWSAVRFRLAPPRIPCKPCASA